MSPAADAVVQRLDAARQKWWLFTLLTTTLSGVCLSFGLLLAFMLADAYLKVTQIWLLIMLVVWLAVTGALIAIVGRRLLLSQRSLEATARRVESEYPKLGSDLINVVQLSEEVGNGNRAFGRAAVDEAASRIGRFRFDGAARRQSRWRRFIYCMQTPRDLAEWLVLLAVLMVIAALCNRWIPNWGSAAGRLLTPWEFVPSVGMIQIEVTPGDVEVMVGARLDIGAKIIAPAEGPPPRATLFITPEGKEETRLWMAAGERRQGQFRQQTRQIIPYKATLPSVLGPMAYRLEIGDSQTRLYTVAVRRKPTVAGVEVTLNYPAYLGRKSETFEQKHADLEAPQFTVARLRITPSAVIAEHPNRPYIFSEGQKIFGRVEQNGNLLVVDEMPLLGNTTFTVHMFNESGHTDPDPRINRVRVLPDVPPTVQLVKPPRRSTSGPGAEAPVLVRAGDDHGLGRLQVEMKVKQRQGARGEGPEATVVKQWTDFQGDRPAQRHYRLKLDPKQVQPGQTVLLRAVAWDKRVFDQWGHDLRPQQAATGWHEIRLIAAETESAAALEQLDALRDAVWKILQKQVRARVRAAMILRKKQSAERTGVATDVRARQIDIQKTSIGLVKSIGQTDRRQRAAIRQALNKLAVGEMLQAVRQCDDLIELKAAAQFDRPAAGLAATQDRIIDALRKLLDVARRAQAELLAEMEKRPGGDLPDEVREKLDELRNKLDEFLKQQKKVIEATENLAKTPVEDFTEEQEQLLEALAAAEDDWAKMLQEFHSDLSKLPEQDFANPSLLQELVEIQTEIKMAEDALLKKTADIAVPLEQLGAEMAEEIKTNLEKWLPDTPDRERWSQEESLTDEDKEAPMAELPGELEDLVGELMEEEDDLFDEMEDVSSSAADSLDAGAGWDAMDGPISNFSAKGVTGNRLPNTSEIGGRAGEGRSGKSSGEFVGDEAVGKGGRKTPSRLTPDPYVKGQIKDHSKDPTGGASGGGKESGQGGEGLEGPVPRSPGQRNMQRLAGKQAALRNKAEGIDLKFQVADFHRTDLKKMIDMMAQIERDLRAGRYQNALRQRKILAEGLDNVKQYVQGEFQVREDSTTNLPSEVQKEILGGMNDPSPAGWEELIRQYFQRLSAGEQKL